MRARSTHSAGLLAFLLSCSSSGPLAPEGVFLPRLDHANDVWPTALIDGTLVEVSGCVFIDAEYEPAPPMHVLLIWPNGTTADRAPDGALRVMLDGEVVGHIGDCVELGGGMVGDSRTDVDHAESLIGTAIPARCRAEDGYWLTSGPADTD
jgi:hypothetical protein